jgi:outer membrane protein assembly factor BamB
LGADVVQSGNRSFYVSGTIRTSAFARFDTKYGLGLRYTGGTQAAPIGSAMSGTFTAIGGNTNKIVWQHKTPYRVGQGGGSTTTAGGLVFRGEPDGNFLAINAKTGEELWRFQTGFGADAPPAVYEVNGDEFVAIATGGNQAQLSANGDAVWVFSLKGQLSPLWPPPAPQRVKAGATVTFTNVGDVQHTATAFERATGIPAHWRKGNRRPSPSLSPAPTTISVHLTRGCTDR